jgi:hypothetical protein
MAKNRSYSVPSGALLEETIGVCTLGHFCFWGLSLVNKGAKGKL